MFRMRIGWPMIVRYGAVLWFVTGVGCATGPPRSGFLDSYASLKRADAQAPAWAYLDPDHAHREHMDLWVDRDNWRGVGHYEKVIVDPVVVRLGSDSRGAWIVPDRLQAFAQEMHDIVVHALEDRYAIVDEAGEGVLRIRLAITDIFPRRPYDTPTARARPSLGWMNATPGGGVFESEMVDSVTGERYVASVLKVRGSYWDAAHAGELWEDAREAMRRVARYVRTRIDEAHDDQQVEFCPPPTP